MKHYISILLITAGVLLGYGLTLPFHYSTHVENNRLKNTIDSLTFEKEVTDMQLDECMNDYVICLRELVE